MHSRILIDLSHDPPEADLYEERGKFEIRHEVKLALTTKFETNANDQSTKSKTRCIYDYFRFLCARANDVLNI